MISARSCGVAGMLQNALHVEIPNGGAEDELCEWERGLDT